MEVDMRKLVMVAAAAALATSPAMAGQFFYKPGDRIPFWYKNLENPKCVDDVCTPVHPLSATVVYETTIADIKNPNTDHASLVTVVGSCLKRDFFDDPQKTGLSLSTTCGTIGVPLPKLSNVATADCVNGHFTTLRGYTYMFGGLNRDDTEVRPELRIGDPDAEGDIPDGVYYRVAVEQFKAMCPEAVARARRGVAWEPKSQ
jgi:hypothetical protein